MRRAHGAKFDLTLGAHRAADGLPGGIEYDTDLFDAATIERLAGRYVRLLAAPVASDSTEEIPLWRLPLLSEAERQAVLVEWNNYPEVTPGAGSLVAPG